jgi:hypothetical protein
MIAHSKPEESLAQAGRYDRIFMHRAQFMELLNKGDGALQACILASDLGQIPKKTCGLLTGRNR